MPECARNALNELLAVSFEGTDGQMLEVLTKRTGLMRRHEQDTCISTL